MAEADAVDVLMKGLEQKVEGGFARVDQRFEKVDQQFEAVDRGFQSHDQRFDGLSTSIDKRFNEVYAGMSEGSPTIGACCFIR